MSTCAINGKTIEVPDGSSINIINNVVYVNGKPWDGAAGKASGIVKIEVTGDLNRLKCDASVSMTGSVTGDVNAGGSVTCGNVGGNLDAGGSVVCENVGGTVVATGSVVKG